MHIAISPLEWGRNRTVPISRIVVHAMAEYIHVNGTTYSAREFLEDNRLSAHALVTPSGVVVKCRNDGQVAWHARGFNFESLGIEFLVPGVYDYDEFIEAIQSPYLTPEQYKAGLSLVKRWVMEYGMEPENLNRHSDIDPERKIDPGDGFPWDEFVSEVYS